MFKDVDKGEGPRKTVYVSIVKTNIKTYKLGEVQLRQSWQFPLDNVLLGSRCAVLGNRHILPGSRHTLLCRRMAPLDLGVLSLVACVHSSEVDMPSLEDGMCM